MASHRSSGGSRGSSKLRPVRVKAKEKGGKITTAGRRSLSKSQFALPDGNRPGVKGRFPLDTKARARNALARAAQSASPAEKKKIQAKVRRKFPGIKVGGGKTRSK